MNFWIQIYANEQHFKKGQNHPMSKVKTAFRHFSLMLNLLLLFLYVQVDKCLYKKRENKADILYRRWETVRMIGADTVTAVYDLSLYYSGLSCSRAESDSWLHSCTDPIVFHLVLDWRECESKMRSEPLYCCHLFLSFSQTTHIEEWPMRNMHFHCNSVRKPGLLLLTKTRDMLIYWIELK